MRSIDTHAHWCAPEWVDLVAREGAANGAEIGRDERGQVTFRADGMSYLFPEVQIDLERRLKAMHKIGVDMHVLSLTSPMVYWAPPQFGLRLSQVYNDACSAAHLKYSDRFVGMAMAPMQAPELAVQEIERASKLPGLRGLYMATHINGKNLDEKEFFSVYAKCEELGWPIFLHPTAIVTKRTPRYHMRNFLGNPYDTGIAATSLVLSGVMDAFPKLDVMLPHAGSTFYALAGRMDHGASVRHELKHLREPPTSYLRRFHYDTIAHNDKLLTFMIRDIGADRFVLGSDYPADMGLPRPVDALQRLTDLSADERALIRGGNAARLLRI